LPNASHTLSSQPAGRLLCAAVLSLAIHGLLAFELRGPSFGGPGSAFPQATASNAPLRVVLRHSGTEDGLSPQPGTATEPLQARAPGSYPEAGSETIDLGEQPITGERMQPAPQSAILALLPGPYYYSLAELDVRPWIKVHVEPQYPAAAALPGLHGVVVLRLYINEDGLVDRISTISATPEHSFEQAAERAFSAARYSPGMKNGRPVKVQLLVEVEFDAGPSEASG
jgi:protein TonB